MAFAVDSQAKDEKLRDDEQTVTANKPTVKDERHPTFRVSELMGKNIVNSKDEGVGEIEDIVLDTNSGNIQYAVVTYGG
ncbi:MAG: photosystem reaction center subunit H, partial [Planctomyces sp.]|nr:photosystem reaction center subunit H [Planctomyces sp.]